MKTIVCYGDSNTWAIDPVNTDPDKSYPARHPYDVRYTGVLQKELGDDYLVCEEGVPGRSTVFDDPLEPYRNGLATLDLCLETNAPADLVILMLGTNDLKEHYGQTVKSAAMGMERLAKAVENSGFGPEGGSPKILIAAPIDIWENVESTCVGNVLSNRAHERMKELRKLDKQTAEKHGWYFIDASEYASPSHVDGVHMEAEDHKRLGEAVARKIKEIFE